MMVVSDDELEERMFIGHFGVALGAKRFAPRTSLGTLTAAAALLDLIWPVLLLTGVEHVRIVPGTTRMTPLDFYHYPISHSLLMVSLWAILYSAAYFAVRRYREGAFIVGALVLSHWGLDAVVHRPDLPLKPSGGPVVGLGAWNHVPLAVTIELVIFLLGLLFYLKDTRARDRIGSAATYALALVSLVIYFGNVFGPPPPSSSAIAIAGLIGGALIVAWAAWIDHHRECRNSRDGEREYFTEKHAAI